MDDDDDCDGPMLANKFPSPTKDARLPSPSADRSERFAYDHLLRSRGYAIKRRPPKGEPIWERNGIEFRQTEALRRERLIEDGSEIPF